MKLTFAPAGLPKAGTIVLFASEGGKLASLGQDLDKATKGHLSNAMKAAGFEGKKDQVVDILAPSDNYNRVFIYGLGKTELTKPSDQELLGGALVGVLVAAKVKDAHIIVAFPGEKSTDSDIAANLASGAALRDYAFDTYKSKKKNISPLHSMTFHVAGHLTADRSFASLAAVRDGNHFARNLVNEPANVLFPVEFANRVKALSKLGVKVEIFTPAQMKKLGMDALLGVGLGSPHESRMVVMSWNGGKKGDKPIAFIGKGVTFDTGGISIKPAAGMEDMKGDMAGAACVSGLMMTLAKRKAKANVIGAIGIVENAVDGKAQRPGDVVKSMSGQTIAVLNTDAEGRLVLADVLWYVQNRFNPKFMINLATLTGAILVALGKEHAGLFSNNDQLSERLSEAGYATGEKVWRMPLTPEYDKLIDHEVADMKNIGGRFAGSITAGQFLQRFVNNVPWAHLDIAGTAMDSNKTAISQSWANGWGVRLLNFLVAKHYEK